MKRLVVVIGVLLVVALARPHASGPLGIYGIVEKVVFEPSEASPERIQVWGAFAYVDGAGTSATAQTSKAARGYLYFRLPDLRDDSYLANVKREWADLKSVAGTGQAVGFGRWGYIAGFGSLEPDRSTNPPSTILHNLSGRNLTADMRVRPSGETPSSPAVYQTNTGIVKLAEQGSHAAIVKQLKDALAAR
jgi:hypothetical protein